MRVWGMMIQERDLEPFLCACMNGQLREHPLAELIHEISAERLSGALRLVRERVKAVVYFDAGEIIFARSNLRLHRFAESVRRWGIVTEHALAATVTEGMSDTEASAALVSAGMLNSDELEKLYSRQGTDMLLPLLLWTAGQWNFDARARLDENVRITLDLNKVLMESARRLPAEFVATRMVEGAGETVSPAREARADLPLLPTEAFVLSRVDGPLRVDELVAISGMPEAEARQTIYALSFGGFLVRENWPRAFSAEALAQLRTIDAAVAAKAAKAPPAASRPAVAEAKRPAPEPDEEAELNVLFVRAGGASYYEVLDVGRNANTVEIKSAYYALARRFHPDRFHRNVDATRRTRIEFAFAQIAQAYETLKDAKTRATYDLKMEFKAGGQVSAPKPAGDSSGAGGAASGRPATVGATTTAAVGGGAAGSPSSSTTQHRAEESFKQGLAALEQSNQLLALTRFSEAARLAPKEARYRAFYGRALARDAKMRRQAETELQAAIALDARNPSYRVMLAELYQNIGLRRRAEGELERALAVDPQHAEARRMLDNLRKSEAGS